MYVCVAFHAGLVEYKHGDSQSRPIAVAALSPSSG